MQECSGERARERERERDREHARTTDGWKKSDAKREGWMNERQCVFIMNGTRGRIDSNAKDN